MWQIPQLAQNSVTSICVSDSSGLFVIVPLSRAVYMISRLLSSVSLVSRFIIQQCIARHFQSLESFVMLYSYQCFCRQLF